MVRGHLQGNRHGRTVRRGDDVLQRGEHIVWQYIPRSCELECEYRTHGGGNTTDNTSCATGGTGGSKTISPDTTDTTSVGISHKESMKLGTVTVPADSTLVFDHWTDQNGNTVANDACVSGDPSGTNGNITDLIAHFESAKQAPEAQPQPIVSTDEDTAKTITLSGTDEDGDNLSFFIFTAPNHGTLGPIGALTCAGTAPKTCSANVTYTPDNDYNGFDIFSFKASDGTEDSYPAPVSMLVNPLNDSPVAADDTKTMSEDGGPLSIGFGSLFSDVEASDANVPYAITNPPAPAKGSLSGAGLTRNFTPAANFNGTVNIDYTLTDRGDPNKCSAAIPPCAAAKISAQKTVTVTVDAVNDAPSFTKGEDQTVNEDAGAQTVDGWATNISAGPNESNQMVDFQLTNNTNTSLFSAQPEVAPDGTLSYTPADDAHGSADVSVRLTDDGGTANGGVDSSTPQTFTIAVSPVNDAPSFKLQANADQTMAEDAPAQSVGGFVAGTSAGPNESDQTVDFQLTNDNNDLFSVQPSVSANGTLSYTPVPNAYGKATVKVRAHDDGRTTNGGVSESAEQTFTINVDAVNDAPIVSNLQGDGAANEGDLKTYTFDIADVDSSTFSASVDCGGAGKGKLVAGSLQMTATNGEFKCKFLDGLLSSTPVNISVQLSDGEKLSDVESKSVNVSNVAPALTDLTSSSQNALAGTLNPVTFTPTATDVSPSDLGAGFSWRWAIDGGANQLYFSTCGTHTVKAQASDKDGGMSADSSQATKSVSVYNGAFNPPLVDGSTNMVYKGQIIPVKISIGCGTTNLTNLTPHIELLSGDVSPESEIGSTTVTRTSVSAADTTQTMRPVDGGYIYNLQVPSNAAANQEYTIRVNPFGATADYAATGMYVVIKIRE